MKETTDTPTTQYKISLGYVKPADLEVTWETSPEGRVRTSVRVKTGTDWVWEETASSAESFVRATAIIDSVLEDWNLKTPPLLVAVASCAVESSDGRFMGTGAGPVQDMLGY